MAVTADQMATLRAALTGDSEGYRDLHGRLDSTTMRSYHILVAAAFFEAMSRRFGESSTKADVVEFVARIRAQYDLADEIDPRTAERLILAAVADEEIDDIPDQSKADHYLILLIAFARDTGLTESKLDEFLNDSRVLARGWFPDGN